MLIFFNISSSRKVFHFGCGQKAGALNQYFDSYRSFCTSHRPRQTCPVSDRLSFYGTANSMCVICMSAVEARASNDTLRAPCCKNTWFHRKCIQRQALAAGLYFFKCPLCCNKEIFQVRIAFILFLFFSTYIIQFIYFGVNLKYFTPMKMYLKIVNS